MLDRTAETERASTEAQVQSPEVETEQVEAERAEARHVTTQQAATSTESETLDEAAFQTLRSMTVGEFREYLLDDTVDEIRLRQLRWAIAPEVAAAKMSRANRNRTIRASALVRGGMLNGAAGANINRRITGQRCAPRGLGFAGWFLLRQ